MNEQSNKAKANKIEYRVKIAGYIRRADGLEELTQWVLQGVVASDDPVYYPREGRWCHAGTLPELANAFSQARQSHGKKIPIHHQRDNLWQHLKKRIKKFF